MLSIIANPQENKPENLGLFNTKNNFITKMASDGGRSSSPATDQNGGVDFGDNVYTAGSTKINGWLFLLNDFDKFFTDTMGAIGYVSTYNNRTAIGRWAVPVKAKAGKTIQGFLIQSIRFYLGGSGVTATSTITLKKMASDGTLTTVATYTGTHGASEEISIGAVGGSPVTLNDGDMIVLEIQIAPATGTHNTTNYNYVYMLTTANKGIINIY